MPVLVVTAVLVGLPAGAVAFTGRTGSNDATTASRSVQASTAVSAIPSNYFTVVDQNGANDAPAQSDLTQFGRDGSDANAYKLFWSWDATDQWTGKGQTGDACALFDSNNDGNIDFAVCGQIQNDPTDPTAVVQTAGSPFVFSCSDNKNDRCTNPSAASSAGVLAGALTSGDPGTGNLITPTDPFPAGQNYPDDSTLEVVIPKSALPSGAQLVNVCSYPSAGNGGNTNPFDCIVNPGGGFLEIKKVAPSGSFGFSVDGGAAVTVAAGDSSGALPLAIGTDHTVAENVPAGWALVGASCSIEGGGSTGTLSGSTLSDVEVASGLVTTCTFTDAEQTGTLKVVKHVVNDNGGALSAGDFSMHVTSGGGDVAGSPQPGSETGTVFTLGAGQSYEVSEDAVSGYSASYSGDCKGTIVADTEKTCTVTNDDQLAKLTLDKVMQNDNGGTASPSDWTLTATGPTPLSGPGATGHTDVVSGPDFKAGTYTLSESGGSSDYQASPWSCVVNGGAAVEGDSIDVKPGDDVVCTITNDDKPPYLTIIKHVVNDNGGSKTASDFTLTIGGVTATGGQDVTGAEAPGVTKQLAWIGSYTVTEPDHAGYDVSYSSDCTGTIALGETKTCTVTNDDQLASLTLDKVVVNDNGGTAKESDWTLTATGPTPLSGPGAAGHTDVVSGPGFKAGTYTLSESGPSGYTASPWSCVTNGGKPVEGDSIDVNPGDDVVCTITNDDKPSKLVVKKVVVNDNGGTKTASDFSFAVDGGSPTAFVQSTDPLHGENSLTVSAGTYTVTEPAVAGYVTTYDNCTDVVIANGETQTCTITNDDQAAYLKIVKHVVNDNGGSKTASDFTLTIGGVTAAGGQDVTGSETGVTKELTSIGSYTVTEPDHTGYDVSYSSDCTGTIALGETKTCTVTNEDKPAYLKIIKHVVNDNGGSKSASDFTLTIGGVVSTGGQDVTGSETGVTKELAWIGSYTVTEPDHAGYDVSYSSDCSGTIGLGETKTCTVTNDDTAPALHLRKVVVNDNGGTEPASAWTLTATGARTQGATNLAGTTPVDSDSGFQADTYRLGETGPAGYTSSWTCFGADEQPVPIVVGNLIDVGVGADITCTVTNDDEPAQLTVIKKVVNDNGGGASPSSFTMTVNGPGATPPTFPGSSAGTTVTLSAGSYFVTESGPGGYTASYSGGCSGTLAVGESATCTVTNNDQPATLTVVKHVVNDDGGTKAAGDFTMIVTGNGPDPASFSGEENGRIVSIRPGVYAVSESGPSGYAATYSGGCSGRIALGQNITCTITNDDVPVTPPPVPPAPQVDLSLTKDDAVDPVALGSQILYTLTITNKVLTGSSDPATNVTLADPLPSGLTFGAANASQGTCAIAGDGLTCDIGTMAPGDVVTVTLVATPAATGTVTNTAVVSSAEPDLDPADNTASATTAVQAPFTPPAPPTTTPTPKPKVVAPTCAKVTVTPLTMKVGGKTVVVVKVRDQKGKPLAKASVTLRGPGILVRGKTNANGVYKRKLAPKKPGIVVVRVPGPAACIGRLGVVGVFQPPVTG